MKQLINKLLDFFIHPSAKNDKASYEKSRITVVIFLIILLFSVMNLSFYWLNGYYLNAKAWHNYLALVATIFSIAHIKYTGNIYLAIITMSWVGLYLITASAFLSGGFQSNDILWYTVLSSASFMFIGNKAGVINTTLSILLITAFYLMEEFEWISFKSDVVSNSSAYQYVNYLLILYVSTFMMYVLVRGNAKLLVVLQTMREQHVKEEIARDFHDQIGNKLVSVNHLALQANQTDSLNDKQKIITRIEENSKEIYDNFRDFIWTLDPKSHDLKELFMYLRDFTEDYFKFSDINVFFHSKPEEMPEMPIQGTIIREIIPIVKEALTNVNKHAQAQNVWISFVFWKRNLQIIIRDDGKGLDKSNVSIGRGLKNMENRAIKIGGNWSLESEPNKGTEVKLSVTTTPIG